MRDGPILVVDDDVDIREVLAETLEDRGFEVVTAANGLDAIRIVRRMTAPPSIILLDLMMPVMDGYGLLEVRRNDPTLASIPVAIITAGHGVDHNRIGDGAPVLAKPIDLPQLIGVLHHLRSRQETSA